VSDGRQHNVRARLPRVGALVRSELGKVGWASEKKFKKGGKLKF